MTRTTNLHLAPLPTEEEIVAAARKLQEWRLEHHWPEYRARTFTASDLAHACHVEPARRMGNGAVAGSWSGSMAPALRLAPRLLAMQRKGLLREGYLEGRYVHAYRLP